MTTRKLSLFVLVALVFTLGATWPRAAQNAPGPVRVTLADAMKMIEAAHKQAASVNIRVSTAVVDARGDVIALGRMPGAGAGTADTAAGKAMLSGIYGQPSAALIARGTNPATMALNDASGGKLRFLRGAVPIIRGNYVIGAIASSGGTGQQDEESAQAGLAVLP